MKPIFAVIAVVSLALVFQEVQLPQSPSTVAGIAVDETTSQPLVGVQVTLTPPASQTFSRVNQPVRATTDAAGRFSLETTLTGGFWVVPTKSGFVFYPELYRGGPARPPGLLGIWVQLTANTPIKNIELRMARPAVISGRVLDAQGRPLTNGAAALLRYTYDKDGKYLLRPASITPSGSFNDRGEFRLYDLQPGDYYLGIWTPAGQETVSDLYYFYYPNISADETKAVPIQVRAGEEVDVGSLQLPPRQKGVELTVRVTAPERTNDGVLVGDVGDTGFNVSFRANAGEKVLRILPGHYDLLVRNRVSSPDYYASATFDVLGTDIIQDLVLTSTPTVTGKLLVENEGGVLIPAPSSIVCKLVTYGSTEDCLRSRPRPGDYQLEVRSLPAGTYVQSAKVGERDILTEQGLNIAGDTAIEIVLSPRGARVEGVARTFAGEELITGSVVLVPDSPYRGVGLRYHSVLTDPNGRFEILGIAPGSYKLYAWTHLEGAAYRNAEFMEKFDDRGKPVKVGPNTRETVELTAF